MDGRLSGRVRERPYLVTATVSVLGYALVGAAFLGILPVPTIGDTLVILLSDLIAVVNSLALLTLVLGYRFIRRGQIRHHRLAMLSAFSLIVIFLFFYLLKVGGGFEKRIVIEQGQFLSGFATLVKPLYLVMLAVHIFLSIISVPVVLHAVVLGLSHSPSELRDTLHPTVGRIAVLAWTLSLFLGVLTYILLNHVYSWEPVHGSTTGLLILLVGPRAFRPS